MRILSIMGSPRKKGNTAAVLSAAEALLAKSHELDRLNIREYQVNGCLGCDSCKKVLDAPGCVQQDDAPALFERLLAADAAIYATPLYCWSFSAQLKAFVDRHYCLFKGAAGDTQKSLIHGKPMALLVTCAGPIEDNADLIQTAFDRMGQYTQSRVIGKYIVPFCTTPDQLGPEAEQTAARMAVDLAGLAAG